MNRGPNHWNAKLSDGAVKRILESDWPTKIVAAVYQVNPRYVRKLRARHARKIV